MGDDAVRRLVATEALVDASHNDAFLLWLAQDGVGRTTDAWVSRSAIAVARRALPQGDRVAVTGPISDVAGLLSSLMRQVGTRYRLIGDAPLITALATAGGLRVVEEFWWMQLDVDELRDDDYGDVRWLDESEMVEVARLIHCAFPTSRARPGANGVRRWAGIRRGGELVAVGADAWSCSSVGFISGVTTHPDHRQRGLAKRVSAFVIRQLLDDCGRVGLYAEDRNHRAFALYRGLGMTSRRLATADFVRGEYGRISVA